MHFWPELKVIGRTSSFQFKGKAEDLRRIGTEWLDRAFVQRDNSLYDLKGAWLLKNLEGDPRSQVFLRKMNLPE